jgi:hypothetical protein
MTVDIENNLSRFANWQSVAPYFGRQENGQNDPVNRIIKPMITRITAANFSVKVFHTGGMGNYYSFFVSDKFPQQGTVKDYLVYLSILAPVGVMGKSKVTFFDRGLSINDMKLSDVLNYDEVTDEPGQKLLQILMATEYDLLTKQDVSQPLPKGLKRKGFCFDEPCDKFFHVLFDWTD